jgi:hypothetical protein
MENLNNMNNENNTNSKGGETMKDMFEETMKKMIGEIGCDGNCEECECEDGDVKVKMAKVSGEEAEKLIGMLRAMEKKGRTKRIMNKVGLVLGGIGLGVLGLAVYAKYSPATTKINFGTDLIMNSFGKKSADITRDDVAAATELFQAKAEFRNGLISNEEYAEKFDKIVK